MVATFMLVACGSTGSHGGASGGIGGAVPTGLARVSEPTGAASNTAAATCASVSVTFDGVGTVKVGSDVMCADPGDKLWAVIYDLHGDYALATKGTMKYDATTDHWLAQLPDVGSRQVTIMMGSKDGLCAAAIKKATLQDGVLLVDTREVDPVCKRLGVVSPTN